MKTLTRRNSKKCPKINKGGRKSYQQELPLLDAIRSQGPDAESYMRAMLRFKAKQLPDNIAAITPPGSILEKLMHAFQSGTNIPLEMPMSMFLAYLSAAIVRRGTLINLPDVSSITPTLWMIVLADSGCGKTWSQGRVASIFGTEDPTIPDLSGAVSAAAMLESLKGPNGARGLWLKDEYGQFLRFLQRPDYADYKDYLLRAYDGTTIRRTSKKDGATEVTPALSMLGMSVRGTWANNVGAESLVDGLAQRYLYVLPKPDPTRHYRDYPILRVDEESLRNCWNWNDCVTLPEYTSSPKALADYADYYFDACNADISESFIRRITWAVHKIALLYHILIGKSAEKVIESDAYGWATRFIDQRIADAQTMLNEAGASDLARKVTKAQKYVDSRSARGLTTSTRDLISGVSDINSIHEAEGIARLLAVPRPDQAHISPFSK